MALYTEKLWSGDIVKKSWIIRFTTIVSFSVIIVILTTFVSVSVIICSVIVIPAVVIVNVVLCILFLICIVAIIAINFVVLICVSINLESINNKLFHLESKNSSSARIEISSILIKPLRRSSGNHLFYLKR